MEPYLALDIETTGLDVGRAAPLQIAAVWDDLNNPIEKLEHINFYVRPNERALNYAEYGAMVMNNKILRILANLEISELPIHAPRAANDVFEKFVRHRYEMLGDKLTVAGKNVAGFDLTILRNNYFDVSMFKHRCLDVGSLYAPDFRGRIPSLSEINKKLGYKPVAHDALSDCYDVIRAVRAKLT